MLAPLTVTRYDAAETLRLRGPLEDLYEASRTDLAHNPFYHRDRFWERLTEMYAQTPGFELVLGNVGSTPVGFAFGCTRSAERAMPLWEEVRSALPDVEIPPDPEPVFIFNEIATHPDHQRRGYGRALHDALHEPRTEPLANLFVRPDNPARNYYLHWGWRYVSDLRPNLADAPLLQSLVRDLRGTVKHNVHRS